MRYLFERSVSVNIKYSKSTLSLILTICIFFLLISCSLASGSGEVQETPTPAGGLPGMPDNPPTHPSVCDGLSAEFEMMVLVGPSDAVGLDPYSVGTIPFSVVSGEAPYIVQGYGQLKYADILVQEWGTYAVDMTMDIMVTGECMDSDSIGELALVVEMTGEQMVEVTADGFHQKYPWAGTQSTDIRVQLMEGASAEEEGWAFILHLPTN
jgi:hypothetical protein